MANVNKVILIGNLTRDPELRYTPGGTAVAEFGLAVNRTYRSQSGEQKEETTFVDIVAWAKQAETLSQYMSKGRPIYIEGRLTYDSWQTQEGQKRSRLRVTVENFQFLGSRGEAGQQRAPAPPRGGEQSAPPAPSEPAVQEGPADDDFNLDDIPF